MNEEELKEKYGINNLGNPDINENDFITENGNYPIGYKDGFQEGRTQTLAENLDFTDGFREGRLCERKYIKEKIEKWNKSHIHIHNTNLVSDEVLEELLSQLDDEEAREKK